MRASPPVPLFLFDCILDSLFYCPRCRYHTCLSYVRFFELSAGCGVHKRLAPPRSARLLVRFCCGQTDFSAGGCSLNSLVATLCCHFSMAPLLAVATQFAERIFCYNSSLAASFLPTSEHNFTPESAMIAHANSLNVLVIQRICRSSLLFCDAHLHSSPRTQVRLELAHTTQLTLLLFQFVIGGEFLLLVA